MDDETRRLFNGVAWIMAALISMAIMGVAGTIYYIHEYGLRSIFMTVWNGAGK